jgi:putative peptidoglycan lipid II flippase
VFAAAFGAGSQMDALVVALRIPNLARDLFAEGALSSAFVPTFTRHLTRHGKAAAWRLGNNVLNTLALITGVLVVCGLLFARPLVSAYARDFASVPGKLELTVLLLRIVLPFLTLVALAAALMGMLNALHRYFVPAFAPAMFNIVTIAGTLMLVPMMSRFGLPEVAAVAIAAVAGGVAQVACQWPLLRREGFRHQWVVDWRDPALHRVLMLMGPGAIGLAATQLNLFVNTLLATSQGTGAVSWLAYAFRLMYLPIGLFGVSIATALLPITAAHVAREDTEPIRDTLARGLGLMLSLNIPATFGLIALATPIVRVLFERGQFLPSDTAATAAALQWYAVGLVGYSTARIASPVFYALGRSQIPVAITVVSMGVNLVASILLVRAIGFRGLALGTSLAALAHGGAALLLLGRYVPGIGGRSLSWKFVRMMIAASVMAAAAVATERWAQKAVPGENLTIQATRLALAIAFGLVALLGSAKLLRIPELSEVTSIIRERLRTPTGP